jgi:hypothetical protein
MCDPVSIGVAGLALSAGTAAYGASQQAGYVRDRNAAEQQKQQLSAQARDAERLRQAAFEKQSMENWQAELQKQGAAPVQQQIDQGQQQALTTTQQVQNQTGANAGLLPGQTGGQVSEVFTSDANRQIGERMADAKQRIAALAKLSGFDRANGYTTDTSNLFNVDQGLLQDQAKRSLGLGQVEGNVSAPWVTEPDKTIPQLGGAIGNAALGLAGSGKQGIADFKNTISSIFG